MSRLWSSCTRWLRSHVTPPKCSVRRPPPWVRPCIEALEPRIMLNNDFYTVPGTPDQSVRLQFDWTARRGAFNNELAVYVAQDNQGRVGGLLPSAPGYAAAAKEQSQVVFSRGLNAGVTKELTFAGGSVVGFFLVQNNTTEAWSTRNPKNLLRRNPKAFFSFDAANRDRFDHVHTRVVSAGVSELSWEEQTRGGDRDFNDLVFRVGPAPERALLAPGHPGANIAATFTWEFRDAGYKNELGLFGVDDAEGRIGALKPGDAGYGLAALTSPSRQIVFSRGQTAGAVSTLDLPAGELFGLYLVQDSTTAKFLSGNPANAADRRPRVFFAFPNANPDSVDHVHWLGGNRFAFEDLLGGGDRDFDDLVARVDFGPSCGFDDALTGWEVAETGGSAGGHGTVTTVQGTAVMREGDSFNVSLRHTFIVPTEPSTLTIELEPPAFDNSAVRTMKDAFEAALVDAAGKPLVFAIGSGHDAFYNVSEGMPAALAPGVTTDGQTLTVSLAGLAAGTEATLLLRLVNNDGDVNSSVQVRCVDVVAGGSAPPRGVVPDAEVATARRNLDFSQWSDVTGSLTADYGLTSLSEDTAVVYADLAARNSGTYRVKAPLLVAVKHLSDPAVRVRDFDGLTPDGTPYYDLSAELPGDALEPGETTAARRLAFFDPDRRPFSYDLVFLGQLNRAPAFTSAPDVEAIAGKPYGYAADATDLDLDPLTFSLTMGPAGATIDAQTGLITWAPGADNVGNHAIVVRVDDGHGGADEQRFILAVRDGVPNRPPVFASAAPVDGVVNGTYSYQPAVHDDDGDLLRYSVAGPDGMTVDPATGRLTWLPGAGQLGQNEVSLSVDDGRGGSAAQTFTIHVAPEPGNHAPVIVSDAPTLFAVEQPGMPTGEVSPELLSLATGEQRIEHVSVRVPPPAAIGSVDLLPASIDVSAMTTDAQTLQVGGTVRVEVRNQGGDGYESRTAGTFDLLVFEDRDGDAAFTRGVDNVLGTATFAGAIAAGASGWVAVPLAGILQFRDKPIWVVVDAGNAIPELDEVNNTLATGLDSRYQPAGDWLPMVQWQWQSPGLFVVAAAAVAPLIDTNGDGLINERDVPIVLVNSNSDGFTGRVTAVRGDTGQALFDVQAPAGVHLNPRNAAVVGDLDGDGRPEILLQNYFASSPFYAFNNDGTFKWASQPTTYDSDLVLVDLDGDGKSEILRGTACFNFDGTLRWNSRFPHNIVGGSYLGGPQTLGNARQPVDLNLDGIPEILAGPSALDRDGKSLWEWFVVADPATRNYSARLSVNGGPYVEQFRTNVPMFGTYSWSAVANLDEDPFPEIIVVSPASTSFPPGPSGGLWIFNHDGSLFSPPVGLLEQPAGSSSQHHFIGPPTVADFDGDGRPEIGLAVARVPGSTQTFADPRRIILYVFETDGTEVWHKDLSPNHHADRASLPSAFDFDGDGDAELVYQDSEYVYILNGRDGATLFQFGITSAGVNPSMIPVIADLDNDGGAEIVAPASQSFLVGAPPRQGIVVISDANDNWVHARRIWNQWLYNPAYVNEDGSIPPLGGDQSQVQDSLREQFAIEGIDLFAAPNLSVSQVTVDASNCPDSVTVTARIGNGGALQAGPGVRVNFYLGDPAAGGTPLGTRTTTRPLFPSEFQDVSFDWTPGADATGLAAGQIFVTVNETPPAVRIVSSNLSLLPNTWARANGFQGTSSVPVNQLVFNGIDGNSGTIWRPNAPIDPGPNFYEVHLPFPVEVSSVTIQNASTTDAFLGTGTPTFSNGFSTTINLSATGAGSVSFPEQTRITWIKLTSTAAGTNGPGLAEFVIGGSYVEPPFLVREGDGRLGNNSASLVLNEEPCAAASPPPVVAAGPDQTVFDGDTVSLNPASFTDPVLLETHTATIDWGDGSVDAGALLEANGSGTIAGSHTYAAEGSYSVTVTVHDAAGSSDADTFLVTVQSGNLRQPPMDVIASDSSVAFVNLTGPLAGIGPNQIAEFDVRLTGTAAPSRFDLLFLQPATGVALGSIPVTVNETYGYAVQALDGDSDPITYRLLDGPAGASIDPAGIVTWTPERPGSYSFLVEAADDRGGVTSQAYTLTVTAGQPNRAPVITSIPPDRAIVFRDFSYPVTAADADGDPLSFFLTIAPAGMAIDRTTGAITWRPDRSQLGRQTVTVSVRDSRGGQATQSFNLEVTLDFANQPPAITSTPPGLAGSGQLYRYALTAVDPENDPVQFDLPLRPAGMTISSATGLLSWTPSDSQTGIHDVIVRARDSQNGVALQHFQVTVREPNSEPVITSQSPPQAVQGLPFEYAVRAQDTAGEPLTFSLDVHPDGMSIDPATGVLRWTPAAGQVGDNPVTIAVSDNRGGTTTQTFTLPVVAAAANDPPQILSTPRTAIHLGGRYVYQVVAVDANADPLAFQLVSAPAGMTIDAAGLVTWEPLPAQVGGNAVGIRVDDGRSGVVVQNVTVDVVTAVPNRPPQFMSLPRTTAVAGRLYAYDAQAADRDGDPVTFALLSAPRGMSIDPLQGTLRWRPDVAQVGDHDVVVQALDYQGAGATQSFRATVRSVNTPPLITSTPPTQAAAGVVTTYQVRGADRDGDPLTFTLTAPPAGMTIDAATGLVQWTPDAGQLGPHDVIVVVDDGAGGSAVQSFTMLVSAVPVNQAPVMTSLPPLLGTTLTPYEYQMAAIDPEGQAVEFLLLQGPAGMLLDAAVAGLLHWTPAPDQVGPAIVAVAARDPDGATAVQHFTIDVADGNRPPDITSTPAQTATAGMTYLYDVQAMDPDGDLLRYNLEAGPAGMSLDVRQTGGQGQLLSGVFAQLNWVPSGADVGTTQTVRVRVTDPRGLSAVQSFDLAVASDTQAPRLTVQVNPTQVNVGTSATVVILATDDVGVQAMNLTVNGTPVALDASGRGSVTMSQAGQFDLLATATDAAGNTGTAGATLLVIDPSVTGAPVVSLTSPANGGNVTAPTDVIGTASDDNLLFYTLAVAPLGSRSFTEIARGTSPVIDGILGRFDPTLLANDSYVLRLTATDTGGNTATVERTVNVAGNLKLGNFTVSFTDMSVPVSGIPITVTRTYDTLLANQNGDLGFGWRLEFRDVRLRTSVPATGDEANGIFNPFQDGTRVYVTLPGGKREGFTFRPSRGMLFGQAVYLPHFVADPGVTSMLTPPGEVDNSGRGAVGAFGTLVGLGGAIRLFQGADGGYYTSEHLPYNPADSLIGGQYVLTTKDGTRYTIDAFRGRLDSVSDRNGNTLSFSAGGIVSSAGAAVTFARDPQGRIVAVTDPAGNEVAYQYDVNGDLVAVTDREDNTTRLRYRGEPAHHLEEVIDPLGRTGVRNEYDAGGRLARLTNAEGQAVQLTHELDNNTETVLDARGNPTVYQYDDRGNILMEIDALGGITERTFDTNNNLLTQTDALGNTTSFSYDVAGNAVTETDPLGNVRRFTYRTDGSPLTVIDPLGNTTALSYSATGNPTLITGADGRSVGFGYDAAGNQTSLTDPAGNVSTLERNRFGNLTRIVDGAGNETVLTYDANGNRLSSTVFRMVGGVRTAVTTRFEYDARNRLVAVINPLGQVTRTEYNALGQVVARIDALGRRTTFAYDAAGRRVRTTYPDGTFETTDYDPAGNVIGQTDRAGRVTRFEYDPLNRLVATIYPDETPSLTDNPVARTEYDAAGQVTAQVDANGNRTEFEYDAAGRAVLVRDALGHEFTSAYDAAGRTVAQSDPLGRTTQFVYDQSGRLLETIFADGTSTQTTYDARGSLETQTDQAGRTTRFEYDSLGRFTAVVDALGQRTVYAYDDAGNLTSQTDANGHVTRFEYDVLNRRTAVVRPLGQRAETSYDAAGNVASTTDFNGDTIVFEYDSDDRLTAKRFPDGTSVQFTYTPTGQRQTVVDLRGTTAYEYDARDRLISRTDPDGTTIRYTHDAAGNQTSVTTPAGTTFYTFDVLNRMQTVTDASGDQASYVYDAAGNLVRTELANGTVETRAYDDLNRLVFLENIGPGGSVIDSFRYTLDATGRRIAVEEADGRRVQYPFDEVYRLIGEEIVEPGGTATARTIEYTYDAVGNRLTRADSADGLTTYDYDDNDRLVTETLAGDVVRYASDDNGNTLSRDAATGRTVYEWDYENRLVGVDTDGNGTRDVEYQYDADGIRVAQVVDGAETRFLIDANQPYAQVLLEYAPGGIIQVSYVYGLDLISQERGGAKSFYHVDGLGSTRALTNALGLVTDRYVYDAFGRMLARTGTTPNLYQFTGEQFDPNVGFNYLRARYYDMAIGRFASTDPFEGIVGQPITLHRYLYGGLDPVNHVDPTGREFTAVQLAVTSTIIGVLTGIAVGIYTESFWWGAAAGIVTALLVNEGLIALGALGQGVATGAARAAFSPATLPRAVRLTNFWSAFNKAKTGQQLATLDQSILRMYAQQIPADLAEELLAHGITRATVYKLFYGTGRAILLYLMLGDAMKLTDPDSRKDSVTSFASRELAADPEGGRVLLWGAGVAAAEIASDEPKPVREIAWEAMGLLADFMF